MVLVERWGTWEELVLGSAVLRHGTADWDAVASELRSRTRSEIPHCFTAQVCRAKYYDLQVLYSGCVAWFEELRKRRVTELKEELAKSEDSIESLESKLESLTSEKESDCNNIDYSTSHTKSISLADDVDYSCKNGLSVDSFTSNKVREWPQECELATSVYLQDECINIRLHDDWRREMTGDLCPYFGYQSFKKKRGPRKRKMASLGENGSTHSTAKIYKKESFEQNEPAVKDSSSKGEDVSIPPYGNEKQEPSQPKRLHRDKPYLEGKSSAAKQVVEKGDMFCAPASNRGPPKGCWRGGQGSHLDSNPGMWWKKARTS